MKIIFYISFFFFLFTACNQNIKQAGNKHQISTSSGIDIIDKNKLKYISIDNDFGKIIRIKGETPDSFLHKVITKKQPKFIYNLSTSIPLIKKSGYKKGTVLLLSFEAITQTSSLETGEAKVLWILNQSGSYKHNLEKTISLSPEWTKYYLPFKTTKNISKHDFNLVLQYGFRPQSFIIKNIKFEVFPSGTKISDLPKTKITYSGMEKDAEWRKEAFERIEKIRKGNFTLTITDNGVPVSGAKVRIELVKHDFRFGAALSAQDIVENSLEYRRFKQFFNATVLENDLKIKRWKNKKRREITLNALQILKKDNIDVKGHVLVWPGMRYLPEEVRKNKDHPKKVTNYINNHVKNILRETKGMVSHWDVVNEAYTNKDLQEITGSEKILYNAFRIAKRIQPQAKRFTNEYGIISKGGIDKKKLQWYYDFIKRVDKHTGRLVDGIGIQSHIGSDLTSPAKVLDILDYYSALDKEISISEFTMAIQEPDIKEQYTRDFMIAAFSHPAVTEFMFWGCMYNDRNKVDIFNLDGSLGTMGKAFDGLVNGQWKTKIEDITDKQGKLQGRGFFGAYKYILFYKGKKKTGNFYLKPGEIGDINIEI